jgi:hypothetical protein
MPHCLLVARSGAKAMNYKHKIRLFCSRFGSLSWETVKQAGWSMSWNRRQSSGSVVRSKDFTYGIGLKSFPCQQVVLHQASE